MTAINRAELLPDLNRATEAVQFGGVFTPSVSEAVVTRMWQLYTAMDKDRLPACRALVDEVLSAAKS
jgi:hypothetical protein